MIPLLPEDLLILCFAFLGPTEFGRLSCCSSDSFRAVNKSYAGVVAWRNSVFSRQNVTGSLTKAYRLTVQNIQTTDSRHTAQLWKLLLKKIVRREVDIDVISLSGKVFSVTINLRDDKYTVKQRVRARQKAVDGFDLEDFELVYLRTGQRLGVVGDLVEFSPFSLNSVYQYANIFSSNLFPSIGNFAASRLQKSRRWASALDELIDGGLFQQILLDEISTAVPRRAIGKAQVEGPTEMQMKLLGAHTNCQNVIESIDDLDKSNFADVTGRGGVDNHTNESRANIATKTLSLIKRGAIETLLNHLNGRYRSVEKEGVNRKRSVSHDGVAKSLIKLIHLGDKHLQRECGMESWKFGPRQQLYKWHPLVHVFFSPSSSLSLNLRLQAFAGVSYELLKGICRTRTIRNSFIRGAFSDGSFANMTRIFLGIGLPQLLASATSIALRRNIEWKPLGRVNMISHSIWSIDYRVFMSYGDGAVFILLFQLLWKMMRSCAGLVAVAGVQEILVTVLRTLHASRTGLPGEFYGKLCFLSIPLFTMAKKKLKCDRFFRRHQRVLKHILDFALSSSVYRGLKLCFPRSALSDIPAMIYSLPMLTLLGFANVY